MAYNIYIYIFFNRSKIQNVNLNNFTLHLSNQQFPRLIFSIFASKPSFSRTPSRFNPSFLSERRESEIEISGRFLSNPPRNEIQSAIKVSRSKRRKDRYPSSSSVQDADVVAVVSPLDEIGLRKGSSNAGRNTEDDNRRYRW